VQRGKINQLLLHRRQMAAGNWRMTCAVCSHLLEALSGICYLAISRQQGMATVYAAFKEMHRVVGFCCKGIGQS
jgi:hypothetical protein